MSDPLDNPRMEMGGDLGIPTPGPAPEANRRGCERRNFEDRRRHNYTPPGGHDRRDGDDRRSWDDRREEVRRLFE